MAYSVEFREAVAYSLSCLNERNQASSIRHREIRRVYGMVSKRKLRLPQVFWDKLAHARFDPGSVYQALFFPRNFNKTGPGDEASIISADTSHYKYIHDTKCRTSTSPPARDAEAFSAVHGIFLHESHMQFQNKISASDSTIISTQF